MIKKQFLISALGLMYCLANIGVIKAQNNTKNKPNILVIITDDQSYETIHALGNKEIFTPVMDKLVQDGTTFTQAHIMGGLNGAICCPSRAMLMSSRSLFHLHQDGKYIPTSDVTFPEFFRAKGYTTFETGKWHQDKATFNRAFTEGDNILFGGMNPPETGGQYRPRLNHYDASGKYQNAFWGTDFSSIYFADAAIKFLGKQKESKDPFLMYVAFTSPHDPRTPPTTYGHSYHPDDVSLPINFMPMHPFDNGELVIRDEKLLPFPRTEIAVRTEIAKYYSMISEVDYQIGRVLDALKKTGKDKNTIIVFAGDNGLTMGQHGLMGKQNPYESAMRVPLVFTGPGIPKDKKIDKYVYLNDIYPTLCDLTENTIPKTVEGESMKTAFTGDIFKGRDKVFFAYLNLQRAVVKDGFKYVLYNVEGQPPHPQLFDLNKDHFEMNNLANDKQYEAKVAEMTALLTSTLKQENDFSDVSKPGWGHPQKWTSSDVINLNK
jgi:arylsulfatase A-like enzyme